MEEEIRSVNVCKHGCLFCSFIQAVEGLLYIHRFGVSLLLFVFIKAFMLFASKRIFSEKALNTRGQ